MPAPRIVSPPCSTKPNRSPPDPPTWGGTPAAPSEAQEHITRADLRAHPDHLFLFGDEVREGKGGQARICRGHPNAVGVATKRSPQRTAGAYWSDAEFDRLITIIAHDLAPAVADVLQGGTVVCPTAGLGTGLAELPSRASKVFAYLRQHIVALKRLGEPVSTRRIPRVFNMGNLGGTLPPNSVYCGRPSPLGNRFVIGRDGTRDNVCDKYAAWLPTQPHLMARVRILVGCDLVCHCAPERCHCDFLLRRANPHLFGCT